MPAAKQDVPPYRVWRAWIIKVWLPVLSVLLGVLAMVGENRERILTTVDNTIKPAIEKIDPFFLGRTTYQKFNALEGEEVRRKIESGSYERTGVGAGISYFFQALWYAITQAFVNARVHGWSSLIPVVVGILIGLGVVSGRDSLPLWHPISLIEVLLVSGGVVWALQHIFLGVIYSLHKPIGVISAWVGAINGAKWGIEAVLIRFHLRDLA
jgi:hypothetical protein